MGCGRVLSLGLLSVFIVILPFPIVAFIIFWFGIIKESVSWKKWLPIYIYVVFIMAYAVEPSFGVDLTRYFAILEQLGDISFRAAVLKMNDNLIVENFLFWVIAQFNMPHLLPAITTSTVYGIGGYITCDWASGYNYRHTWKILAIQFLMIPLILVACNIRNVFSFSIVTLAVYREFIKKRRDLLTVALYILPVFMHKTGILLVVIRLLVPLLKKILPVALVIIFSLPTVITFAYNHIGSIAVGGHFGQILQSLVRSSYFYLLGESEYAEKVSHSLGAIVTRYVMFLFLISLLILFFRQMYKKVHITDFEVFGYLLCIFSLSCNVINTPAYWRFAAAACIAIPPLLYHFYSE